MFNFQGPWSEFAAHAEAEMAKDNNEQAAFFLVTARDAAVRVLAGVPGDQVVRVSGMWQADLGFHLSIQKM